MSGSGGGVEIFEASVSDAEGILRHAHSILNGDDFNVTSIDEFDISVEQEREWIQGHIDNVGQVIFVAKLAGEIVGQALNWSAGQMLSEVERCQAILQDRHGVELV